MTHAHATVDQDSVVAEIDIDAPPETVFRALTDQKQLVTWWGKEPSVELHEFTMDARAGGRWRFRCTPKPGTDHGEIGEQLRRNKAKEYEAHGEIVEIDPPRLVVWSWIANWHEQPSHRTIVRWELTPTKKGTRVRMTHSGLTDEHAARKDYKDGWTGVLQLLYEWLLREL
jgi:uncharacterized protein YndB with AHSA1/START domain